ncbi:hypothetical protein A1O3_03489 [Capronia epimyces CBS 606.96]|uniref:Ubiquitin-like protease family profile domain-containing protein n=1 Tax=Capronia epimyces CBS 606.96 TaxID=1182542 RepID=W9Y149_9EURO|nr:uncharacterized protein A1O3_03489 [Capronia epimyces CBS 606.96]EXJ86537.1 hypothetical protein A1O3_03489 [Capronia epimyces CBS 606.96]
MLAKPPHPSKEYSTVHIQERIQEPTTSPKKPAKVQTPYPRPRLPRDTPPPASGQLRQEEDTPYESDSGTTVIVTRSLRSNKRKLEEQGRRTPAHLDGPFAAKRIQTNGPSVKSPQTPTPVILVHETRSTATDEARTPVDTSLLTPPRVRNRKVSTPESSIRNQTQNLKILKTPESRITSPTAHTLHTPESDISSTCDVSPGLTLLEELNQTRLPVESDISSAYNGSPPDLSQDARLFNMIMAGGGSLCLGDKTISRNEAIAATHPTEIEQTSAIVSETSSNHIETAALENGQEHREITLSSDKQQVTTESEKGMDDAPDANRQSPAPQKGDLDGAATSGPKTPEHATNTAEVGPTTPLTVQNGIKSTKSVDNETPELKLAKLTLEDQYTPDRPTPKASPHSSEKKQRVTRAESKRLQLLEEAYHYRIASLTADWERKIQIALRHGHGPFKAADFTRVVPIGQGRGTDSWLNDEVINGYLKLVVAHGRQNDRPTQVPTHHAFVSFFYNNLESKGYDGVKRWANRAKIGGKSLLETEHVFIPINSGMHWTLCVVSGKNRSVTHYNSLGGNGRRYVETVKDWVKHELGAAFKEEEWTLNAVGESPQQQNMDDCGVFTITSARQIMLGLTPMSYNPGQIPLQRRRIVAELINGALIKGNE